jgi:predicted dehydrogenase
MVGHTFLFSPRVEEVVRVLGRGVLGNVHYATSARLNLGLHQRDVGVIWDLAAHDLSILFHLLGEFPVTVQTNGRAVVDARRLDVAFMNFTFASGVIANVNVSWLSPRKVRNTIVVGDRQMLSYDDLDNDEPVRIYDKGVESREPNNFGEHQMTYRYGDILVPHIPARGPLQREIAFFLESIETGSCDRSSGRFGLRVVEALEAAEESWRRDGNAVPVHARIPDESVIDLREASRSLHGERVEDAG